MPKLKNKTAVVINLDANAGAAQKKWENIQGEFVKHFDEEPLVTKYRLPFDFNAYIKNILNHNIYTFIIGGGDGTIHTFINALYQVVGIDGLGKFLIGAIGFGSSNDFFKPSAEKINGIPIRISIPQNGLADAGMVKIFSPGQKDVSKLFVANAGFGVIAEANYKYNNPDRIISFLKNRITALSILYTAIKTILEFKNIELTVCFESIEKHLKVSNMSITLIPYISGNFHYKNTSSSDGKLDLFICKDMGKRMLLRTLIDLAQGQFSRSHHKIIDQAAHLKVTSEISIPLETDGDVTQGTSFEFSILRNCLKLMN